MFISHNTSTVQLRNSTNTQMNTLPTDIDQRTITCSWYSQAIHERSALHKSTTGKFYLQMGPCGEWVSQGAAIIWLAENNHTLPSDLLDIAAKALWLGGTVHRKLVAD